MNQDSEKDFLIDTGAASVIIDEDYAAEIGVEILSSFEGSFLGGKKAEVKQGHLETLTLGAST
ncbi:MAG: retroviral-like aspartic protease family protein [Candidatus Thorarchaeota archaeon]